MFIVYILYSIQKLDRFYMLVIQISWKDGFLNITGNKRENILIFGIPWIIVLYRRIRYLTKKMQMKSREIYQETEIKTIYP